MANEIYFDNSATTKPSQAVVDIVVRTMTEDYGNPSSMHTKGVEAEAYVRESAKIIAGILKVSEKEICFTSGGTEANNHAVFGTAYANQRRGKRIVTTPLEHAAVSEPMRILKKNGFDVQIVPVNAYGMPDLSALRELINEDTILVSAMYVNNEIGACLPVADMAKIVHENAPYALFHVDAVQAFGKYRIYPRQAGIDLLSVSGHKFHGPKGVGFLYIRGDAHIVPYIYGGGQQGGMRSGTDNVPGIAGIGVAAREAYENFDEKIAYIRTLRERLLDGIASIDGAVIHGLPGEEGAPHIVNAAFTGVRSEVLLHALEERGIYISAGSACSSHKKTASPTLLAIGCGKKEAESSVRFSLCETNRMEEVDETVRVLREMVPLLARYRAR